jgi:hypothetical protein
MLQASRCRLGDIARLPGTANPLCRPPLGSSSILRTLKSVSGLWVRFRTHNHLFGRNGPMRSLSRLSTNPPAGREGRKDLCSRTRVARDRQLVTERGHPRTHAFAAPAKTVRIGACDRIMFGLSLVSCKMTNTGVPCFQPSRGNIRNVPCGQFRGSPHIGRYFLETVPVWSLREKGRRLGATMTDRRKP